MTSPRICPDSPVFRGGLKIGTIVAVGAIRVLSDFRPCRSIWCVASLPASAEGSARMRHIMRPAIALCCLCVCLASDRLLADTGDAPGAARIEPDKGDSNQGQGLSVIVQAGAKLLGKGSRSETPNKE